jgi:hypothetical protein
VRIRRQVPAAAIRRATAAVIGPYPSSSVAAVSAAASSMVRIAVTSSAGP